MQIFTDDTGVGSQLQRPIVATFPPRSYLLVPCVTVSSNHPNKSMEYLLRLLNNCRFSLALRYIRIPENNVMFLQSSLAPNATIFE